MPASRREFLTSSSLAAVAAALNSALLKAQAPASQQPATPGAPPAFGTAPGTGPEVSGEDFAYAEKLVQFEMTEREREQAAGNWRKQMAPLYELRVGPRKLEMPQSVAPATVWNPILPGMKLHEGDGTFVRSHAG